MGRAAVFLFPSVRCSPRVRCSAVPRCHYDALWYSSTWYWYWYNLPPEGTRPPVYFLYLFRVFYLI